MGCKIETGTRPDSEGVGSAQSTSSARDKGVSSSVQVVQGEQNDKAEQGCGDEQEGNVMNMSLYRMGMGESSTALGRVSRAGVRLTQSSMEVRES